MKKVIPELVKQREQSQMLRIWVAGCATGEEAYSMAIIIAEQLKRHNLAGFKVQIFATDVEKESIDKARAGWFPASIADDVSPERLHHFFTKDAAGYRINKDIRSMVVFAVHNVAMDPPFTKIDLISCRNLLIYFTAELQRKLIPLFHYSLLPGGVLFLGSSETIGRHTSLFTALNNKWKFYRQRSLSRRGAAGVDFPLFYHEALPDVRTANKRKPTEVTVAELTQRALLESFSPPAAVINARGDILHLNGRTGKYLEPPAGKANMNIFAMAREGLRIELPSVLHAAMSAKKEITLKGIRVKTNGDYQTINLAIRPLAGAYESHEVYMVVFEDVEAIAGGAKPPKGSASSPLKMTQYAAQLEKDLMRAKELLQTTTEEMEVSQEELRSSNEELQSTNEELQSTNEELTSSKEEMQSLNEELMTVNAELQAKIDELTLSNSDMRNLLYRTEIATIFLDSKLNIRRYTPEVTKIINLIESDIGRPVAHLTSNLKYDSLVSDAKEVLDTLIFKEMQLQNREGLWYTMRLMPYRTVNNVIDGVVITFSDISALKRLEEMLKKSEAAAREAGRIAVSTINAVREPLVILDNGLKVVSANRAFYDFFRISAADTEGCKLYDLGSGQWNISSLRVLLEEILSENTAFDDFPVGHEFPKIGYRKILLNARRIETDEGNSELILLAMQDVTDRQN